MPSIIDGKKVAAAVRKQIKADVQTLKERTGKEPGLAVILVGDDPASAVYVKNKEKACRSVGMASSTYYVPADVEEKELLALVDSLNEDPDVHGILCQLPLPEGFDKDKVLDRILPAKDVDGLHPYNAGMLAQGRPTFVPCTPAGIIYLLKAYEVDLAGKQCLIIGRSQLVGKPLFQLLLKENATVTVAHSKSKDLADLAAQADVLLVAAGVSGLVTKDFIKPNAVVIDVGIHRGEDGKLSGDVRVDAVSEADKYTPVPGGVGPMTIAMLLQNTLQAFERQLEGEM